MTSKYCADCQRTHLFQAYEVARSGMTWPEVVGFMAQIAAAILVGAVAVGFLFGLLLLEPAGV